MSASVVYSRADWDRAEMRVNQFREKFSSVGVEKVKQHLRARIAVITNQQKMAAFVDVLEANGFHDLAEEARVDLQLLLE